jgi:hypothetical protein
MFSYVSRKAVGHLNDYVLGINVEEQLIALA